MPKASFLPVALLVCATGLAQQVCECDAGQPASMAARQCSLCTEAEKAPAGDFFYLRDANPRKQNRWLVLPRRHGPGNHHLHEMTPLERTTLWTAAIAKGRELWGDDWGAAYNGAKVRTQCHAHIHIGKLLKGVERDVNVITVDSPSQIPAPKFEGVWIHPVGNRLHVHLGEQTTETALLR